MEIMQKRTPLSKFESLAQRLVEGSFDRFLGGQVMTLQVATKLARAMEDAQDGGRCPDHFVVRLNEDDLAEIRSQNEECEEYLADYVVALAQSGALTLAFHPEVTLVTDDLLPMKRIVVVAGFQKRPLGMTTQLQEKVAVAAEIQQAIVALDAFLVVEGHRQIPLDKPQFSLGRKTENDVVLDSATVSRFHAQIRWRYGRFVLYDLSNRNGRTLVNGQAITDCVLKSGDVLTLSDVSLLYGEGHTVQQPRTNKIIDETQVKQRSSFSKE